MSNQQAPRQEVITRLPQATPPVPAKVTGDVEARVIAGELVPAASI